MNAMFALLYAHNAQRRHRPLKLLYLRVVSARSTSCSVAASASLRSSSCRTSSRDASWTARALRNTRPRRHVSAWDERVCKTMQRQGNSLQAILREYEGSKEKAQRITFCGGLLFVDGRTTTVVPRAAIRYRPAHYSSTRGGRWPPRNVSTARRCGTVHTLSDISVEILFVLCIRSR